LRTEGILRTKGTLDLNDIFLCNIFVDRVSTVISNSRFHVL
jgi:hypothetical protein